MVQINLCVSVCFRQDQMMAEHKAETNIKGDLLREKMNMETFKPQGPTESTGHKKARQARVVPQDVHHKVRHELQYTQNEAQLHIT